MRTQGRGFTLIELLVVIAIIAILAAILFPVFARARAKARQTSCASNLKQTTLAILMYVQDYNDTFPLSGGYAYDGDPGVDLRGLWLFTCQPYIKNEQALVCPSDPSPAVSAVLFGRTMASSYGYNCAFPGDGYSVYDADHTNGGTRWRPLTLPKIKSPTLMWLLADSNTINPYSLTHLRNTVGVRPDLIPPDRTPLGPQHSGGLNFSFVDGHVKWLQGRQFVGTYNAPQCKWSHEF